MKNVPDEFNGDVAEFSPGQRVVGRVVQIENFGAFVELTPTVVGLVLIPDVSWQPIRHPSEVLSVGQTIEAVVLVVAARERKVSLSVKRVVEP